LCFEDRQSVINPVLTPRDSAALLMLSAASRDLPATSSSTWGAFQSSCKPGGSRVGDRSPFVARRDFERRIFGRRRIWQDMARRSSSFIEQRGDAAVWEQRSRANLFQLRVCGVDSQPGREFSQQSSATQAEWDCRGGSTDSPVLFRFASAGWLECPAFCSFSAAKTEISSDAGMQGNDERYSPDCKTEVPPSRADSSVTASPSK